MAEPASPISARVAMCDDQIDLIGRALRHRNEGIKFALYAIASLGCFIGMVVLGRLENRVMKNLPPSLFAGIAFVAGCIFAKFAQLAWRRGSDVGWVTDFSKNTLKIEDGE